MDLPDKTGKLDFENKTNKMSKNRWRHWKNIYQKFIDENVQCAIRSWNFKSVTNEMVQAHEMRRSFQCRNHLILKSVYYKIPY